MTVQIKRRGRPPKERFTRPKDERSDAEVMKDLKERFRMLDMLTMGAISGEVRSTIVSGAPGVGKTYTVAQRLGQSDVRHEIVNGGLSAVNLYKLAYDYSGPGNVIVLDDADGIFKDEDALNVLKALCDSTPVRRVSWRKESAALKRDGDDIPQSFNFYASFIFISNLDFQYYVDMGANKMAAHFEALMGRSLYLDLRLHTRRAVGMWVRNVALEGRMFQKEGISNEAGEKILAFLENNRERLREYSLRTVIKAAGLYKTDPIEWESMARVLLCR